MNFFFILFADDVVVFSKSKETPQLILNDIELFAESKYKEDEIHAI